ncbi:MAG: phage terminase large subunit [Steroidobacter sp.]
MSLSRDLLRFLDPLATARDAGFEPDPWQCAVIESDDPRVLINASRQSGKSTTVSTLAVNQALTDPGLILATSPSQRQSGELFRKIVETLRAVKPAPKLEIQSATTVELSNGARIVSLPGSEATIRCFSAPKLILIDEASRVDDDYYAAVRPMLAAGGGRLIALSTPWGCRGWFYKAWQSQDAWRRFRVPATDCPRITPEFLAEELAEIGPLRFASEYMCEFVDTAEQFFPTSLIEAALTDEVQPLWPMAAA